MTWISLFLAGAMEIVWAVGLKYTQGFTRFWPSVLTVGAMIFSFFLLARALRALPIGTAYAIWTGIGVIGTTIWGILVLSEPRNWARLSCILLILLGIVGLRLTSAE